MASAVAPGPKPRLIDSLVYRPGRDPLVFFTQLQRQYGGVRIGEYLAQMRRTIEVTGAIPGEPVPGEMIDALQRAFEEFHGTPP